MSPPNDRDEAHGKTDPGKEAAGREAAPPAGERERVLKARAEALATAPEAGKGPGEALEVVEFLLARERYAVETSFVREVLPLRELTPLPGTPPFVLGVVNVRGRILSVTDLKRFFDLPEKGLTDLDKVILLSDGRMEFGILADDVPGVRSLPAHELRPSLPTLTGIRERFLKGVTPERVVVLDAGALLSDAGMVVVDRGEG